VAGAEVQAALAAAQAGVDRDRGGGVGAIADAEGDGAVGRVGGDLGGRVLDHALCGFCGFLPFFLGDFGAEPGVFLVFDDAVARYFACFVFVRARSVAGFGVVVFVARIDQGRERKRQAQRLRRDGDCADGEQGHEQGGEKLSHRPTIGALTVPL